MAALSPADVKRWDLDAIDGVFQTASDRAATLQTLGDALQQVHSNLSDWHGEAGEAFRADIGKTRRDIDADGQESRQVAAAVSRAEADVRAVKSELDGIEQTAQAYGFSITPDWRIDPGAGAIGFDSLTLAAEEQLLQGHLDTCKLHAHNADQELANAVRGAVGEAPVSVGTPAPAAPAPGAPTRAGGKPQSWQDMLLPAGPASPRAGGDPAKGAPVAAGAATGTPPSLEDLMLGRGQPAIQKPPPGSPLDLLSRIRAPVVPPQRLNPADIESFKALARNTMIAEGVPPDQIEAKLNDAVARTQQWMDAGMPHYVAPEPPKPPPPGFGEGFADRWNSTITGIQDLVGANGLDPMRDAWGGMANGLAGKAQESLIFGPVAPFVDAAGEVKSFADNPAYYAGERAADGAISLPTMLFGGEGAVVKAGLGDVGPGVLDTGPAVSTHAPIGLEHPLGYNPWAEGAAYDVNYGHWHDGPTAALGEPVADMSTHYVGDNPERVVLGKFQGYDAGYIGEARRNGGIYFDTGDPTWNALTEGFGSGAEKGLVWHVNEHFLRNQMENEVPRIEYVLPDGYDTVEQLAGAQRQSYSAMEIKFLQDNAAAYGYEQQGNTWIFRGGK